VKEEKAEAAASEAKKVDAANDGAG